MHVCTFFHVWRRVDLLRQLAVVILGNIVNSDILPIIKMQICNVCSDPTPKYRCPACKIRYCSVICYKRHKDSCLPVPSKPTLQPKTHDLQSAYSNDAETWTAEDLLDEEDRTDQVSFERLQLLGASEDLRDLLRNPHLRQLIRAIDAADSKADAMRAAMQEPLFVEFSDRCLTVVERDLSIVNRMQ